MVPFMPPPLAGHENGTTVMWLRFARSPARGIDRNDLYDVDESDIVKSGVAHIAVLQAQGFAYLKP